LTDVYHVEETEAMLGASKVFPFVTHDEANANTGSVD